MGDVWLLSHENSAFMNIHEKLHRMTEPQHLPPLPHHTITKRQIAFALLNHFQLLFTTSSREMCEASRVDQCVQSTKVELKFPFRKAPDDEGKFPFRNLKYYTSDRAGEARVEAKTRRLGYVAQRSINFLESTGRKPNLENVLWFKAAHGGGKRW